MVDNGSKYDFVGLVKSSRFVYVNCDGELGVVINGDGSDVSAVAVVVGRTDIAIGS